MGSDIQDFYAGANVFVTGATGFVGICLIEKLLRCIPDINAIYILIRPKRNKTVLMRLDGIMQNQIFNTLKEQKGVTQLEKLIPVTGDINKENLDLSTTDQDVLIANVNFVFHCAANLNFSENLKNALNTNLLGTIRLLELCKRMNCLKAFVHVSSAYVNFNKIYVKELVYPLLKTTERIIEFLDSLDEATVKHITPAVLDGHPNCYTFSKSLAEVEITKINDLIPTVIVRPSIITGAWKEPVPGWTNSKNGPQGFIMAAARGILRRIPVNRDLIYDYIPVDIVVNEIIASAWYVVKQQPLETLIFHCTTSTHNPFKWSLVENEIPEMLKRYPLKSAVWYPTLKLIPSLTMFRISAFIFHMIPAYVQDFATIVNGKKPVLVKLHKNINKSLEQLSLFIYNEWKFDNSNSLMLHDALSSVDKDKFGVNVKNLEWKTYFNNLVLGVRQYLNNETPDTISAAKKRHIYLWLVNTSVQIFVVQSFTFIYCLLSGSHLFSSLWVVPVIAFIFNFF